MAEAYHQSHQPASPKVESREEKRSRHRRTAAANTKARHRREIGPPPHIIALGPWLRLVSDETIASELGISVRSLRCFFRVLQLPTIELPTYGRLRFVDFAQFTIAMKAILRIGQPDFLAPAARSLLRAQRGRQASKLRQNTTRTLTPRALRKNLTPILAELALKEWSATFKSKDQALAYASRAARHLLHASLHTVATRHQAQMDAIALSRLPPTPTSQVYNAWSAPTPDPGDLPDAS